MQVQGKFTKFLQILEKDLVKVMFNFFPLHSLVGYIVLFSSVLKAFCKLMQPILLHIKYIKCRRKAFDAHGTLGLCPFIFNLVQTIYCAQAQFFVDPRPCISIATCNCFFNFHFPTSYWGISNKELPICCTFKKASKHTI